MRQKKEIGRKRWIERETERERLKVIFFIFLKCIWEIRTDNPSLAVKILIDTPRPNVPSQKAWVEIASDNHSRIFTWQKNKDPLFSLQLCIFFISWYFSRISKNFNFDNLTTIRLIKQFSCLKNECIHFQCVTDWITIPCATNTNDPTTQSGTPVVCVDRSVTSPAPRFYVLTGLILVQHPGCMWRQVWF